MSQRFLDVIAAADPSTRAQANLLLDTNVMLEIYSIGAILRVADELIAPEGQARILA